MNRVAIDLNNQAIKELKDGSLYKALEKISQACNLTAQHGHKHSDINPSRYRFHWEDCTQEAVRIPSYMTHSSDAFLYLKFLTISTPSAPPDQEDSSVDLVCPCGFAWAIWYNMAVLYALAGSVSGERGQVLLHCAFGYLDQVKVRTEVGMEQQPSRDWSRLQIAVLNNQACISNELCLHHQATAQLDEMRTRLSHASQVLDSDVWKEFTLNLQCMHKRGFLAAAA